MKKVRVAVVGCGKITLVRHAPEYASNENVELKGFYDAVPERAQELARKYGGKVYYSFAELIHDADIDAVSICTINIFHKQMTIDALNAGKHVLCEKPMAINVAEAEEMILAAERNNRFLMIGHNQRLVEAHIRAKQLVDSGELGKILTFETTFRHAGPESWGVDKGVNTWFFQNTNELAGSWGDLGVHKVDLIRWLLADEVEEVMSCQTTRDKTDMDGKLVPVNDNAICILKLRSGIVGTITTSWTCYGEENNGTVLYCTNGVVRICDNPDYSIVVSKKDKGKAFYQVGAIQTNEHQTKSGVIDLFVDAVMQNKKPEISGEEGLAVLKVLLAGAESAKTGKMVRID